MGQPTMIGSIRGSLARQRTTVMQSHDCQGKLLSRLVTRSTVSTTSKTDTLADRQYAGPFTFSGDTLFRVDFPGGYFDEHAYPNYLLTDRLGSVDMVVNINGAVVQHNGYYPYGEPWREPKGNHLLFSGKERLRHVVSDSDYGPRLLSTSLCLWKAPDRFSGNTPWLSPYAYCGANPVANREIDGNWYIKVSSSADRGLYPYAIMTLYSTYDEAIYATVVKVRGRHSVRNVLYGDTPQGYSKITGWKTNDNVLSFGPNPYLQLDYQPGQEGGTRNAMQMHGGQEEKRKILNELIGTLGCIRITDEDLVEVKQIVDALEMGLPNERPEFVWVIDDLEFPVRYQDREEIKAIPIINLPEIVVPANKDRDLNIEGK